MKKWLLEARDYEEGEPLCFCPIEDNGNILIGMAYLSSCPPEGSEFVGVFHQDGQKVCEKWCEEHEELIKLIKTETQSHEVK